MAQRFSEKQGGGDTTPTESPPASVPARQDSGNPILQPSRANVPVTPGIGVGEYTSSPESDTNQPTPTYFSRDHAPAGENKAGSIGNDAPGRESNREILRRISLSGASKRQDSLDELDPRAANPSLGLSGGIISATFCIPHSLQYTKGSGWVRSFPALMTLNADYIIGIKPSPWYLCPL
jgi:trehalose 6-phosphate synthase/phosphatase